MEENALQDEPPPTRTCARTPASWSTSSNGIGPPTPGGWRTRTPARPAAQRTESQSLQDGEGENSSR